MFTIYQLMQDFATINSITGNDTPISKPMNKKNIYTYKDSKTIYNGNMLGFFLHHFLIDSPCLREKNTPLPLAHLLASSGDVDRWDASWDSGLSSEHMGKYGIIIW